MQRRRLIIIILVAVLVPLLILIAIAAAWVGIGMAGAGFGDKVALIHVDGVITSGRGSGGLFGDGSAGSEYVVGLLERARKDGSVKSVVVRINSPGGSAAGSQEIYQEVNKVRRSGKKVTVSMGDVAASGGYYIACAADRIYAQPSTLTGSIGVIMATADVHELLGKLGIDLGSIKSGKHKDMGTFTRPMTPDERRIAQDLISDVFDQFVADVSKGRKLDKGEVKKLADGRVYTGRQALKLKLIDRLGGLEDALRAAADDAGIKGEFDVVEYERGGLLDLLFGGAGSSVSQFAGERSILGELARKLLTNDRLLQMQ